MAGIKALGVNCQENGWAGWRVTKGGLHGLSNSKPFLCSENLSCPRYLLKRIEDMYSYTYTQMFTVALFIIVKKW